jgi:hypothetical protein
MWHRPARRAGHSCLPRGGPQPTKGSPRGTKGLRAFAEPSIQQVADPLASLTAKILIANLELEFHLTHRKLSPLRFPNRKFSPLFHLTSQLHHPSLTSSGRIYPPETWQCRFHSYWPSASKGAASSAEAFARSTAFKQKPRPALPPTTCAVPPAQLCAVLHDPKKQRYVLPSLPFALIHPRKLSSRFASCDFTPLALTHPRNSCGFYLPIENAASVCAPPLAQPHPRNSALSCMIPTNKWTSSRPLPFAQTYPRTPYLIC